MRQFGKHLVCIVQAALSTGKASERTVFQEAIRCVKGLMDFACYARYEFHDEGTLSLMRDALHTFHDSKSVFAPFRNKKSVEKRADNLVNDLRQERDTDLAESKGHLTRTQMEQKKDEWHRHIDSSREEYLRDNSDFNFPKLHMLKHFEDAVRRFGALSQWSTETSESCHRTLLKKGYQASNGNSTYSLQILNYDARLESFAIRELNLNALRSFQDQEGVFKDPPDEPAKDHLLFKSRMEVSQLRVFRQLASFSAFTADDYVTAVFALPGLKQAFKEDANRLLQAPIAVFKCIEFMIPHFQTSEMETWVARCTGNMTWYGGSPWNDWVWYSHGTLEYHEGEKRRKPSLMKRKATTSIPLMNKRRVGRLVCLFILRSPGGEMKRYLAGVEETVNVDGGHAQAPSDLACVVKTTPSVLKVMPATRLLGPAHVIPQNPLDPEDNVWWVNTYIDLTSWNTYVEEPGDETLCLPRNKKK
jgi:hypothetical protein